MAHSRSACINAAKQIIHGELELELEKEHSPFVQCHLKFSSVLYSIFVANVIFLLTACLSSMTGSSEPLPSEMNQAWRILQEASTQSVTAAKVRDMLLHFHNKYQTTIAPDLQTSVAGSISDTMDFTSSHSGASSLQVAGARVSSNSNVASISDTAERSGLTAFEDLLDKFGREEDVDILEWDNVFMGLDAAFV